MKFHPFIDVFTPGQWRYIRSLITLVIIAEALMFILNRHLVAIYLVIAGVFFLWFTAKLLGIYREGEKPLVLDFWAVILALFWALLAKIAGITFWRFLLILTSSGIVLPQMFYVISDKFPIRREN